MKIEGIIFDVDGTIAESLGFWDYYFMRLGELYNGGDIFRPEKDMELKMRVSTLVDGVIMLYNKYKIGDSEEALVALSKELYKEYYNTEVVLKPGVLELLSFCSENGIKMCIASGTTEDIIRSFIKRRGIDEYFSEVFTCTGIGKSKAYPDIYEAALRHLGTPKNTTWVFEDSAIALETARKAGFNTVGLYDRLGLETDVAEKIATVYLGCGTKISSIIDKIEI